MFLEIKNLHVLYKTVNGISVVLDNFNLSIDKGETVAIVGESGSGKSTLGGAITRLLPSSAEEKGEIVLNGKDILKISEDDMTLIRGTSIFMIFQNPLNSLNPVKTVGFQLMEAEKIRVERDKKTLTEDEIKNEVIANLELVRLPDPEQIFNRYPHELSGGQIQRVVIAMALILRPDLLIADEPTTALDVTIQAQVINLLKELNKNYGMTIIFITHDLSLAYVMANDVMVMYAGRIMEFNESNSIVSKPAHPYTISLLKSVPTDYKGGSRLYYILGSPPSFFSLPRGCKFNPRCDKVFEKCRVQEPTLFTMKGKYEVRCWLFE